jgi:hypothetical protein
MPVPELLTSVENITLRLVFAFMNEQQYNRTSQDYTRIASALPPLKVLHHEVNRILTRRLELNGPPYAICRFRAGDQRYSFEPFPTSISIETIRTALVKSVMRQPRRRRVTH